MDENISYNTFDNGTVEELLIKVEQNGSDILEGLIRNYLRSWENATLDQCEETIAACELIASLKGNFDSETSEHFKVRISKINPVSNDYRSEEMIELAADALDRIGAESELKDLWEDREDFNNWLKMLGALQNRLLT